MLKRGVSETVEVSVECGDALCPDEPSTKSGADQKQGFTRQDSKSAPLSSPDLIDPREYIADCRNLLRGCP